MKCSMPVAICTLWVTGWISGRNQGPSKVDSHKHDTGDISKEPFYGIDMFRLAAIRFT